MLNNNFRLELLCIAPGGERNLASDAWCVLSLKHGRVQFVSPSHERTAEAGDALILSPGIPGRFRAPHLTDLVAHYFHFHPEELVGILSVGDRMLLDRAGNGPGLVHVLRADCPLARELQALTDRMAAPDTLEHRCQLLQLLPLVVEELRSVFHQGIVEPRGARDRMIAVMARLTEPELQTLSIEDLARRCGCSRRQFTRLVRDQFGCSAVAWKSQVRLEKAAALLQNPQIKVISVAFECGFNHLGRFTAQFKERFGTTPAKWRNQVLGNGTETQPAAATAPRSKPKPSVRSQPERGARSVAGNGRRRAASAAGSLP